jgi:hypothetical protein
MTINIELRTDEERALLERARLSGRDLIGYVHQILQAHLRTPRLGSDPNGGADKATLALEDLIDDEAVESCAREVEGKEVPSLEEVRAATSKIKDSMARVVIEEERAERF